MLEHIPAGYNPPASWMLNKAIPLPPINVRKGYGYFAKENLSAEKDTKKAGAWFPEENEHPGWTGSPESKKA